MPLLSDWLQDDSRLSCALENAFRRLDYDLSVEAQVHASACSQRSVFPTGALNEIDTGCPRRNTVRMVWREGTKERLKGTKKKKQGLEEGCRKRKTSEKMGRTEGNFLLKQENMGMFMDRRKERQRKTGLKEKRTERRKHGCLKRWEERNQRRKHHRG